MLRSAQQRADDETSERLAQAWYTAVLGRVKHIPSLQHLIAPEKGRPSMDDARASHQALLDAAGNN